MSISNTPKYSPDAPLTKEHLKKACAWAAGREELPALKHAAYDQEEWTSDTTCGTSYCIHGAAHLLARGIEADVGPSVEDYTDCPRIAVALLGCAASWPELIEAACDAPRKAEDALEWLRCFCLEAKTTPKFYKELLNGICIVSPDILGSTKSVDRAFKLFTKSRVRPTPGWLQRRRLKIEY